MDLYTQNEVDLEGLQRLKRPKIRNGFEREYWNRRKSILALLLMGILFIGAMVLVGLRFGSEVEQVQAVDELFI